MEFTNYTPFPALAFQGIDQGEQKFHVLVLRQTLSFANGPLAYVDEQAPLCAEDEFFGEANTSSVRQESDLCHYKPKCDVLVNATAVAPGAQPVPRFAVRLKVSDPQGQRVLEKTLTVTGARAWEKSPTGWKLNAPEPLSSLPLRYEYAYGGQCRVNADDPHSAHVPKAFRLTPEQQAQHPEQANPPLAHTVCESNLLGQGYSEPWYRDALKLTRIAAPQIEALDDPIREIDKPYAPQGLGVRHKGNPARRKLGGTIDAAFIESDRWLPEDFDFAVWNAAPEDQQCDFLQGDETLELINLCPPNTPGALRDTAGNTILRLALPGDLPFVLVNYPDGRVGELSAHLDTLIIDTERKEVSCVWRATVGCEPEIAALEFRMLQKATIQELRKRFDALNQGAAHG